MANDDVLFLRAAERLAPLIEDDPRALMRLYRASPNDVYRDFTVEAAVLESHGYEPVSVTWTPGVWEPSLAIVAVLLSFIVIGLFIALFMLITRPAGTLAVIFRRV